MRSILRGERQPGQVLVIMALSMTALMGMTGVAIDLGYAYAHHREVQNSADVAAVVGAQALGRQIIYTKATPAQRIELNMLVPPYPTAVQIQNDMKYAAAASVPPYPDVTSTPNWPANAGGTVQMWFLVVDPTDATKAVRGCNMSSCAAIPPDAVGVRVEAEMRTNTFFAKVMGFNTVNVWASSAALLKPLGPSNSGGPFIVCGGSGTPGTEGAWLENVIIPLLPENTPNPPGGVSPVLGADATGVINIKTSGVITSSGNWQILDRSTNPPKVNPAFEGQKFRVGDQSLKNNGNAACGNNDSKWKGNADSTPCTPVNTLPCNQASTNGSRSGPQINVVGGMPGCNPGQIVNCVALLPIADSANNAANPITLRIVTYRAFYITQVDQNTFDGELLPAAMATGIALSGTVINPSDPGLFVVAGVSDSY